MVMVFRVHCRHVEFVLIYPSTDICNHCLLSILIELYNIIIFFFYKLNVMFKLIGIFNILWYL